MTCMSVCLYVWKCVYACVCKCMSVCLTRNICMQYLLLITKIKYISVPCGNIDVQSDTSKSFLDT